MNIKKWLILVDYFSFNFIYYNNSFNNLFNNLNKKLNYKLRFNF